MQVETDFNGLRNGPYSSWGCHSNSNQMSPDADLLPEKIYSMVAKLVDEDNEIDVRQANSANNTTTEFYSGTTAWTQDTLSSASPVAYRTSSPTFYSSQLAGAGLEQLDLSQNMLDLSFLSSVDDFDLSAGKIGENIDSGFASPADKTGCLTGSALLCDEEISALSNWDWGLSKSFDPDSSENYINLIAQNPELLDQIVHGETAVNGILNNAGLSQVDFLQSNGMGQSAFMVAQSEATDNQLQMEYLLNGSMYPESNLPVQNVNVRPNGFPNVGLVGNSQYNGHHLKSAVDSTAEVIHARDEGCDSRVGVHISPNLNKNASPNSVDALPSLLESFAPFRPPPELPFTNAKGPLGFNNNDYRSFAPQLPRTGFNLNLHGKEVQARLRNGSTEHDGRAVKYGDPIQNFGNGFGSVGNSGIQHPRLNDAGPFRWPPPFLPARLPMYPPPVDPVDIYPLPWTHRTLFPLPPPIFNVRPMRCRRNPVRDELSARLDQCYEQFRLLEKERKKTEAELARHNPGKKLSSANSMTVPRLPPNPTRVDRLVVDQLREHARVVTLVGKMERLRNKSFAADVHSCLLVWDNAIRKVQALRQDEVRCRSRILLQPSDHRPHQEDKGIGALAGGIYELSVASRHARTSLWACLTVTLNVPSSLSANPSAAAPASAAR